MRRKRCREKGRYGRYLRKLRLRKKKEENKVKENNQSLRHLMYSKHLIKLLSTSVMTLSHPGEENTWNFYSISCFIIDVGATSWKGRLYMRLQTIFKPQILCDFRHKMWAKNCLIRQIIGLNSMFLSLNWFSNISSNKLQIIFFFGKMIEMLLKGRSLCMSIVRITR